MKKAAVIVSTLALAAAVHADIYTDSITDLHNGVPSGDNFSGYSHLNIRQVEVTNDATTITFTISVVQNPINAPTDWGNYMVGINSIAGGDSSGNAWTRPISMPGMDFWLGSWVNGGGGAQLWSWNGSSWTGPSPLTPVISGDSISITTSLASLGVGIGDTITFDVYSSGSGGGDSAVDALSASGPSITTWGGPYDTGSSGLNYTIIPEPSTIALVSLFGVFAGVRMIRRKQ